MSQPPLPPNKSEFNPKETAAAALNEQGFLFAQIIREKIANKIRDDNDTQHGWEFLAQVVGNETFASPSNAKGIIQNTDDGYFLTEAPKFKEYPPASFSWNRYVFLAKSRANVTSRGRLSE